MNLRLVKAQSAIEYLMTYGWMLIVVSVVSGTVYSTIEPNCVESASGLTDNTVHIEDFGISATENRMDLVLDNRRSDDIIIQSVKLNDNENSTETKIGPGQSESRSIPGVTLSDSCNNIDVKIEYSLGPYNQNISGEINGPYKLNSIKSPYIQNVEQ